MPLCHDAAPGVRGYRFTSCLATILLLALFLVGCNDKPAPSGTSPAITHKPAPVDPWLLTCVDPIVETPALLWNGQIGIRIGRDGTGSGPMFSSDEYDTKGEEKIRTLSNILEGQWRAGNSNVVLSPTRSVDYSQTLDMKTSKLTTSWSQEIEGVHLHIKAETILDAYARLAGQRWTIESDRYIHLGYTGEIKGASVQSVHHSNRTILWALPPSQTTVRDSAILSKDIRKFPPGVDNVSGWSARGHRLEVSAAADKARPFTLERWLTIEPSPQSVAMVEAANPSLQVVEGEVSQQVIKRPAGHIFDSIARYPATTWANRWQTDIEIDGPVEDQQAIRSFLFYLRSAISPDGKMSISPYGLSSETYGGHIFWDADIWVFPAVAFIDPEGAKAISDYRLQLQPTAIENFQEWFDAGRPTATGKLGKTATAGLAMGVKYPWESSVTGKETVPGPSKFEDHITGSVSWMIGQAAALGFVTKWKAESLIGHAASFYRHRSTKGAVGQLEIKGTMSPDENHTGDNDLYTNLLAQWCLNGGSWERRLPVGKAGGTPALRLPRDNESFLTYDNDPLRGYKQAAAVLSIYPLQYPPAEKEAKVMMERFADKVIQNGPAMSDSVHALIWARLGEADKAYDTWHKSWMEFVKEPHLQFSEKRRKATTYFTTGAAGCLQTVIYGFLGFRIDSKKQDGALWSTNLALGQVLSVKPNLPKSWKSVKFKNFTVLGKRYTLIATHKGVQVIQGDR